MTERVVQAARFFDYYWEKANDEELYELNDIKTNDFMQAVEKFESVCNLAVQACRITRRRFNKNWPCKEQVLPLREATSWD